jgi:hypothetical protein
MEEKKNELLISILIAVFAAVLAINDLGAGRYGDDEMIAHNKRTEQYNWYQSKSIKQTLKEGQLDFIIALEKTNSIKETHKSSMDTFKLDKKNEIERYDKEKKEILEGSANIDSTEWVLIKENKKGQIVGAKEWEAISDRLGVAGDYFDLASLFLQICIVFGAISLVVQMPSIQNKFMYLMIGLGIAGFVFSMLAYNEAMI